MFVVDASVAMTWHFEDEKSEIGDAILSMASADGIIVPAHWRVEVANAALVGERHNRAAVEQTAALDRLLDHLTIEIDIVGSEGVLKRTLPIARACRLTIYDALYLELASRRGLALASFDRDLVKAARAAGVEVLT